MSLIVELAHEGNTFAGHGKLNVSLGLTADAHDKDQAMRSI